MTWENTHEVQRETMQNIIANSKTQTGLLLSPKKNCKKYAKMAMILVLPRKEITDFCFLPNIYYYSPSKELFII